MQSKELRERMLDLVANWSQSGLSQKAYCEQHGIRYHVFHYWFKRYRQQAEPEAGNGFIAVRVQKSCSSDVHAGIELILADGKRLLFHHAVSADFIKAIIC
jgi:hypothetical protein